MWRWRDWVIDAYNRNLPFDQFTIEQIAGDLLPSPTLDQKIATGFNRNHRGNSEGGIIPEEYAVEYVVDRVDTTATVWLGLTLGLRPLPQPQVRPDHAGGFLQVLRLLQQRPRERTGDQARQLAPDDQDADPRTAGAARRAPGPARGPGAAGPGREPEVASAQAAWESSLRKRPPFDWVSEDHLVARISPGRNSRPEPNEANGRTPASATASPTTFQVQPDRPSRSTAVRSSTPATSPGSASSTSSRSAPGSRPTGSRGGTILSRMVDEPEGEGYSVVLDRGKIQVNLVKRWLDDAIRVETAAVVPAEKWTHVAVTYDGSRLAAGVKVYVDGKLAPIKVLLDELNQTFQSKEPLRIGAGGGAESRFAGAIDEPSIHAAALDCRGHRRSWRRGSRSPRSCGFPRPAVPRARRGSSAAVSWRPMLRTRVRELHARIRLPADGARRAGREHPHDDGHGGAAGPGATHVLFRGQYDQPGPRVEPGYPGLSFRRARRARSRAGWTWPAGWSIRQTR